MSNSIRNDEYLPNSSTANHNKSPFIAKNTVTFVEYSLNNSKLKKKQIIWLAFFIALIAAMLIFDSKAFKQPEKLQGGFKEVAFYRNQNNAGPVVRIYAATVQSPDGADYEGYGNAMPYTLHGNTKVYFFDKKGPAPERLKFDYPHFDTLRYKAIKAYERNGADIVSIND